MKKEESMFAEVRKQLIVELVNKSAKVTVNQLCEEFSVSPATIRNDLRELEDGGFLKRTHGGAISNRKVTYEPNAYQKEVENVAEKKAIARRAFAHIEKGDSIALDTGTTTFELAKLLVDCDDLTVVTNDLQIAAYLECNSNVNIIMAGGLVRRNFHCTAGKAAVDTIQDLNVDKAFIAANGVHLKKGLCTPHMDTARVKSVFTDSASQVVLMTDSTKIGNSSFVTFAQLSDIDVFITDENADKDFLSVVEKMDIDIEIAKK